MPRVPMPWPGFRRRPSMPGSRFIVRVFVAGARGRNFPAAACRPSKYPVSRWAMVTLRLLRAMASRAALSPEKSPSRCQAKRSTCGSTPRSCGSGRSHEGGAAAKGGGGARGSSITQTWSRSGSIASTSVMPFAASSRPSACAKADARRTRPASRGCRSDRAAQRRQTMSPAGRRDSRRKPMCRFPARLPAPAR